MQVEVMAKELDQRNTEQTLQRDKTYQKWADTSWAWLSSWALRAKPFLSHTHTHTEWGRNRNQSSTSPCHTCNILDLSSPGVWPQHDQLQSDPWQPVLQEKMKFKLTCKKNPTPLHQSSLPCFSSGFIYKKNREMNTCFSQEITHPTKKR